jgi:general secretion pathway protein C
MADVFATESPRSPRRAPAATAGPAAEPAAPAAAPASEARTAAVPPGTIALSRAEVDSALADFGKLTLAMHGRFTAAGVAIDGVGDGTIFARAGLRAGDVIAAVDGTPLRSLDDAANLYARASSARAMTAQILRNGAPLTLRVAIQ